MLQYWYLWVVAVAVVLFVTIKIIGRVLRFRPYSVKFPDLPSEFDGFRIAVISDLHDRRFGRNNRILAKKMLDAKADLVVIAGDMHEEPKPRQPFYDLLTAVSETVPVAYAEGNHELRQITDSIYSDHLRNIADCGAVILNDSVWSVERGGRTLKIYGQSWNAIKSGIQPKFDSDCPSVLVAHDPMQFDRLSELPDLMISGHVHGGILRLPLIGAVFAPGDGAPLRKRFCLRYFFPKYSRGLYFKDRYVLAVTQGLGFSVLPIRFIPPEVMVLTLKTDKK